VLTVSYVTAQSDRRIGQIPLVQNKRSEVIQGADGCWNVSTRSSANKVSASLERLSRSRCLPPPSRRPSGQFARNSIRHRSLRGLKLLGRGQTRGDKQVRFQAGNDYNYNGRACSRHAYPGSRSTCPPMTAGRGCCAETSGSTKETSSRQEDIRSFIVAMRPVMPECRLQF
jgi:hypothetical protein